MPERIRRAAGGELTFQAPDAAGAYRVFVFLTGGKGNGACANIPFFVRSQPISPKITPAVSRMDNGGMLPLTSRRTVLSLAAGAGRGFPAAAARKRILIPGGTGFLGPATIASAPARGRRLTLFNRGKTRPELFPHIEKLRGGRDPNKDAGLSALEGRRWDAVIDNSGYYPRMVGASARILANNASHYTYISSISAYASDKVEGENESGPLASIPDPSVETMGKDFENFGALKALCEKAAEEAMPGRVTIVRPGYIVGPDDPSGRFTYWPVRMDRGGEVLAPGTPAGPVQFIDVRDLGEWLVKICEDGIKGVFNATGPGKRTGFGELLNACRRAAGARTSLTWVPAEFLEKVKIQFPIWAPYRDGTKGAHTRRIARAVRAGLRFRPVLRTVEDTLAWYKTQQGPEGRTRLAGPTPDQEKKALEEWKRRRG